jgi:hypothetical protein
MGHGRAWLEGFWWVAVWGLCVAGPYIVGYGVYEVLR